MAIIPSARCVCCAELFAERILLEGKPITERYQTYLAIESNEMLVIYYYTTVPDNCCARITRSHIIAIAL